MNSHYLVLKERCILQTCISYHIQFSVSTKKFVLFFLFYAGKLDRYLKFKKTNFKNNLLLLEHFDYSINQL